LCNISRFNAGSGNNYLPACEDVVYFLSDLAAISYDASNCRRFWLRTVEE
jgi:hypothetical protein